MNARYVCLTLQHGTGVYSPTSKGIGPFVYYYYEQTADQLIRFSHSASNHKDLR